VFGFGFGFGFEFGFGFGFGFGSGSGSGLARLLSSERMDSVSAGEMAPSQKASIGRMPKGSSICRPSSSMPRRRKVMRAAAGTVARWFHEESADQMASGSSPSQKPT